MLTYGVARERGIRFDEAIAAPTAQRGLASAPDVTSFDRAVQNVSVIDPAASDGWAVIAVSTFGYGKSLVPGSIAIFSGDADIITALVAKGADPNRKMNLQ